VLSILRQQPDMLREMQVWFDLRQVRDRLLRLSPANIRRILPADNQAHHLLLNLLSYCHQTAKGWL